MSVRRKSRDPRQMTRGSLVRLPAFQAVVCRAMTERWFVATVDVIPFSGEMLGHEVIGGRNVIFSMIPEPDKVSPPRPANGFTLEVVSGFQRGFIDNPTPGSTVRVSGHVGLLLGRTIVGDFLVAVPQEQASKLPISGYRGCVEMTPEHKMYVWRISPMVFRVCELPTINSYRIAKLLAERPRDKNTMPW